METKQFTNISKLLEYIEKELIGKRYKNGKGVEILDNIKDGLNNQKSLLNIDIPVKISSGGIEISIQSKNGIYKIQYN